MTARTQDYDAIIRIMQLYNDTFDDNDIGTLREAFHEDAWISASKKDGSLVKNLISESFETWASHPNRSAVGRFISATRMGDVAGLCLSAMGDQLYIVALAWVGVGVFDPAAGYLIALQAGCGLVAAFFAGHWADRVAPASRPVRTGLAVASLIWTGRSPRRTLAGGQFVNLTVVSVHCAASAPRWLTMGEYVEQATKRIADEESDHAPRLFDGPIFDRKSCWLDTSTDLIEIINLDRDIGHGRP